MVNQEAYFYGLSGVMEERNTVHAINHEEKLYEMESQFWVFILIKRSKVFYCIKELEDHSY